MQNLIFSILRFLTNLAVDSAQQKGISLAREKKTGGKIYMGAIIAVLASSASLAVSPSVTAPALTTAMSGSAMMCPVPVMEIVASASGWIAVSVLCALAGAKGRLIAMANAKHWLVRWRAGRSMGAFLSLSSVPDKRAD